MNRKSFIQKSLSASLLIGANQFPFEAFAAGEITKITLLHTNDQHSRIDPFPMDGSKNQGLGGMERRAALIEQIRASEKNVLLVDSGDIFQGTPYFNKFMGAVEIELMNKMGYDATTFGNHDFDGGMENLALRMSEASFPFLNSNYNFDNTAIKKTKPYKVIKYGSIKIGIFGVGIELSGLVPGKLFGETKYNDPIASANKTAAILKQDERCDLVICLSHLGYKYSTKKVSDIALATETKDIDVILGGHTHTFMPQPETLVNKNNQQVIINQAGWAGIMLGRIDLFFDYRKRKYIHKNSLLKIG
jgi:5'-nucleotidase